MTNVCAFRTIGTDVDLDVATFTAPITNGVSTITMSDPLANVGTSGYASTHSGLAAAGLGTPSTIDLRATLDFSSATLSGAHTGGDITVTATLNP